MWTGRRDRRTNKQTDKRLYYIDVPSLQKLESGWSKELKKRCDGQKGVFHQTKPSSRWSRGFLECSFPSISSTKTICDRQIFLTKTQCTGKFFLETSIPQKGQHVLKCGLTIKMISKTILSVVCFGHFFNTIFLITVHEIQTIWLNMYLKLTFSSLYQNVWFLFFNLEADV